MTKVIILVVLFASVQSIFDIMDFGAIPHSDTIDSQFVNAKAIYEAIKAANSSTT